jgi:peptidoglycan/xylan/chitin deacetylase (PgdA/CDA1 family)
MSWILAIAFFCLGGCRGPVPGAGWRLGYWPTLTPSPTATAWPGRTITPAPFTSSTPTATQASPTPTPTATVTTPTATPTAAATATPTPTAVPPGPTPDGVRRTLRVPILMYHYISVPPASAGAVRRDLSVTTERFEAQLQYLRDAGYTGITLDDLAMALETGAPLPDRPIILTFDDGYRDHYYNAYPLLQKYGFPGTFFLITSFLDNGREEYLTWDQVTEMHAGGMEFGAHGYTHDDLRNRSVDYLVWQMLGPRQAIEERIGEPVHWFCYPSGYYDDLTIRVCQSANYWGAVVITAGAEHSSDGLFELTRIRVHGSYGVANLAAAIDTYMNP